MLIFLYIYSVITMYHVTGELRYSLHNIAINIIAKEKSFINSFFFSKQLIRQFRKLSVVRTQKKDNFHIRLLFVLEENTSAEVLF